jgi:hypothetical protein
MKYGGNMPRGNGSGDQVPSVATKSCTDKRDY